MHAENQAAKCIGKHSVIDGLSMDSDYLVLTEYVTDIFYFTMKKIGTSLANCSLVVSRVSDTAGCEEDWREGKAIREGFIPLV